MSIIKEWVNDIINGTGGWKSYEYHEVVATADRDLAIAEWVIRCLGNPHNAEADAVLKEIADNRFEKKLDIWKPLPTAPEGFIIRWDGTYDTSGRPHPQYDEFWDEAHYIPNRVNRKKSLCGKFPSRDNTWAKQAGPGNTGRMWKICPECAKLQSEAIHR